MSRDYGSVYAAVPGRTEDLKVFAQAAETELGKHARGYMGSDKFLKSLHNQVDTANTTKKAEDTLFYGGDWEYWAVRFLESLDRLAALKPELEIVAAAKVSNSVSDVPIYAVYHSPVGSTTICSKDGYILYGSFEPNWSNVRGSKGIVFPLDDKPDWIKNWEKTVWIYKSC